MDYLTWADSTVPSQWLIDTCDKFNVNCLLKFEKCYQKLQKKMTVKRSNPGSAPVRTIYPGVLPQLHLVMEESSWLNLCPFLVILLTNTKTLMTLFLTGVHMVTLNTGSGLMTVSNCSDNIDIWHCANYFRCTFWLHHIATLACLHSVINRFCRHRLSS